MKTLKEIVIHRLEELGLGTVEAAKKGDLERTFIRDITEGKKRTVQAANLEKLAKALRLDPIALARHEAVPLADEDVRQPAARPNASFPPKYQSFANDGYTPVLGQSVAGPNGRFILNGSEVARVFTPPMLEGVEGAYAVRVYGTSMEPRYEAGETVWLNPNEPVRRGDDVVVQLITDEENGRESYIKRFISLNSHVLRLWQHNPDEGESRELEFDASRVFSVHKVVFHATA